MSANLSSLASVLDRPRKTWDKVPDHEPLALFHHKFWAKSMEPEREWHNVRSKTGEVEDEDEDVLPGCYYLNIDIKGLWPKGLCIRPDYVRIYDALHRDYPLPMDMDLIGQTPCAVITGQPGIGKSIWIWYATRRRMATREPFLLYYGSKLFLFVQEGVYDVSDGWQKSDFRYFIWTFVDSDETRGGIPPHFV
ncbi:hypothetical protein BS47DRAFT_426737 [Hydnum rufescens UP504]|uniref:Uncharacterized protein n=1 Tax=Hydnum rufescens UP504 TaxID=1448309 RepID=A0A9P6B5H7_9AGAM|nr:hypothetical protein BS47DRAFT_426737 [Hydnum rufescens UP504]